MAGKQIRRSYVTESQERQVLRLLEHWPDISYAEIAGRVVPRVSRNTVKRIAGKNGSKDTFRSGGRKRPEGTVRCPGCGGLVRKKKECLTCLRRQDRRARRTATAASPQQQARTLLIRSLAG